MFIVLLLYVLSVSAQHYQHVLLQYGAYGAYLAGVPLPINELWNPKSDAQIALESLLSQPAVNMTSAWNGGSVHLQAALGLPVNANDTEMVSLRSPANYIRLMSRLAAGMAAMTGAGDQDGDLERYDSSLLLSHLNEIDSPFTEHILPVKRVMEIGTMAAAVKTGQRALIKALNGTSDVWEGAIIHRTLLLLPPASTLATIEQATEHLQAHAEFLSWNAGGFILLPDYADLAAMKLIAAARLYPDAVGRFMGSGTWSGRRHLARALMKAIIQYDGAELLLSLLSKMPDSGGAGLLSLGMCDWCFTNNDLYDAVNNGDVYLVHGPTPFSLLQSPWEVTVRVHRGTDVVDQVSVRLWADRGVLRVALPDGMPEYSIYRLRDDDTMNGTVTLLTITANSTMTVDFAVDDYYVLPRNDDAGVTEAAVEKAWGVARLGQSAEEDVLQLAALLSGHHVMAVVQDL